MNFADSVDVSKDDSKQTATAITKATIGDLDIEQQITLRTNAKFFRNKITLKNTGSAALAKVRFMRSHDPDNTVDQGGSYVTDQKREDVSMYPNAHAVSATS